MGMMNRFCRLSTPRATKGARGITMIGHQYELPIIKEIMGILEIREDIPGIPNIRPNPIKITAIQITTNGKKSRLLKLIEHKAKVRAVVPKW